MINTRTRLLLLAALLLALSALASQAGHGVIPKNLAKPLVQLPRQLGSWVAVGKDGHIDSRTLKILKPSSYLLRAYKGPGGLTSHLFVGFFSQQLEGAMIHSPQHCMPGGGWKISSRRYVTVANGSDAWRINHVLVQNGLAKISVLYWYQGRGRVEASEYRDRIQLVFDGLRLGRSDGALVRITTPIPAGGADVFKIQLDLAARLIPALGRILPTPGQGRAD